MDHVSYCTELQLAALLGKTLLEKNAELEKKLRKLQDFAEEAASEKKVFIHTMLRLLMNDVQCNQITQGS